MPSYPALLQYKYNATANGVQLISSNLIYLDKYTQFAWTRFLINGPPLFALLAFLVSRQKLSCSPVQLSATKHWPRTKPGGDNAVIAAIETGSVIQIMVGDKHLAGYGNV